MRARRPRGPAGDRSRLQSRRPACAPAPRPGPAPNRNCGHAGEGNFVILPIITKYPVECLLAWFIFSNAVGAMPKPTREDWFYAPLYRFAHGLAGNILYAINARFGRGAGDGNSNSDVQT